MGCQPVHHAPWVEGAPCNPALELDVLMVPRACACHLVAKLWVCGQDFPGLPDEFATAMLHAVRTTMCDLKVDFHTELPQSTLKAAQLRNMPALASLWPLKINVTTTLYDLKKHLYTMAN